MKWIDYREKLGIGFSDDEKALMLRNKVSIFLQDLADIINEITRQNYTDYQFSFKNYFYTVGELPNNGVCSIYSVKSSIISSNTISELISKYVAFQNVAHDYIEEPKGIELIKGKMCTFLDELRINYCKVEDDDGLFIFPAGAKELDDALVSEPLEWLSEYSNTRKTYVTALKQYSDGIYIRDVADNLRKALEAFLQEFLGNEKNLETNKNEICKYLGEQGVDAGIAGLFQPIINAYKNINDRIAKHNDAVDAKLLEFLLYQTGVLIRMVLTVKEAESEVPQNVD